MESTYVDSAHLIHELYFVHASRSAPRPAQGFFAPPESAIHSLDFNGLEDVLLFFLDLCIMRTDVIHIAEHLMSRGSKLITPNTFS